MLAGETTGGKEAIECSGCKASLNLGVYGSAAGYYLGYWCGYDGPIGRETGYFDSHMDAAEALSHFKETGELRKKRS